MQEHLKRAHPLKIVEQKSQTIDKFIERTDVYEPSSSRKAYLDKKLAEMVASDLHLKIQAHWIIGRLTPFNSNHLQNVQKKILIIPASSTETERIFSKAGEITAHKLSSLKPKAVDMLIFLKHNNWLHNGSHDN
ncbi:PREDICTED: uncharacterized protein LOC108610649 [Drosophila arizonae]|uniref:Uncharacterized protein LOC108610649 n=1 Tax=Drosophila arizonae TaxID=7263 RepID=A0ABM1NTR2_DROAR|nr:PREDICTED: uncharacterized protein LOC108610649 [Drosophila arizonae]